MKPGLRLLAAIFALTSLLLLQAEGLWAASACSEMEMSAGGPMASEASPGAGSDASGPAHPRDGHDSPAPACPLMAGGAATCLSVGALIPGSPEAAPGRGDDAVVLSSSDHAKDLLLAVSLLRPPRA